MESFSYISDTGHIILYAKPINMRLGEDKIKQLCQKQMGIDPQNGDLFLFFNSAKDKLKLFYLDNNGSQELIKFLPKGGFMLPIADTDQSYIKLPISKLSRLFRSSNFTIERILDNAVDILNYLHDGCALEV